MLKGLKLLTVPNGMLYVPEALFADCENLKTLKFNDVVSISKSAFEGTSIIDAVFPNTLKYIDARAFADCKKLVGIRIPDSVITIGNQAFSGCAAMNIEL